MGEIETALGRIGLLEAGGSDALPVVFLHGVGSDKSVWKPQIEHFGRTRRAVAFDYPGYGESKPMAGATRDDFAAALLAAMDSLGLERAHVCGLSLGGIVATVMHAAQPARCASLILADSFALHPEGPAIFERSVEASRTIGMRALAEARVDLLLGSAAPTGLRAEVIETMAAIDPEAYRVGAEAVWLADQRRCAAEIRVPTLVLCGDEDRITPPALSEELARLVAGARFETIASAGHLSNAEKPSDFNSAVDRFLVEVERDSS